MSMLESTAGHAINIDAVPVEEQRKQIRLEQLKLLVGSMPLTIIATLANVLVLAAVLWPVTSTSLLLPWVVYMFAAQIARLLIKRRIFATDVGSETSDSWHKHFATATIAIAIGWGMASLLLFPAHSMMHQVFLAFIIAAICAGSVTTIYPSKAVIAAFLALTLLPLSLRFLTLETPTSTMMAAMILLFLFLLLAIAERLRMSMLENITTRFESHAREIERLRSEARLRDIVLNSSDLIWETDCEGRYTYCSSRAHELLGFSVTELVGKTPFELMDEQEAERLQREWQTAIRQRQPIHDFSTVRRHRNGRKIILQTTAIPLFNDQQQFIGFRGLEKDITDQVAAEEQLHVLSEAVAQAGESVIITDRYGVIEYVNNAFCGITGYSPEEVIGHKPTVLKSGKQTRQFYQDMWQTISSGKIWKCHITDQRKDGSFYPAAMSIAPIQREDGITTHYVAIQQDMSAQQRLEEQFRQAQKMDAIGTLVGGIAHDFNNMLFGITGNLHLAEELIEGQPEVTEHIRNAEKLGFDAASVIQQLLTFARTGKVDVHPFGLTSFAKEIFKLDAISIPENIRLTTSIGTDELVIRGDATQLHQVILNLLTNARDALEGQPDPEIEITLQEYVADTAFLQAHQDHGERLYAHLRIRDNGCGIDSETLPHIFDPFYSTKEAGRGTGLGMAMVFGAIQSHRGIIEVESEAGTGTTIHIYLPLLAKSELTPYSDEASALARGDGETILICDDNAGVLEAGTYILESLGYKAIKAHDGQEAVELFHQHQQEIDLALFDIVMPRMGGVEAAAAIQMLRPDIPIIFVTGYDRDQTLARNDICDRHVVLAKPFSPEQLSQELYARLRT